MYFFKYTKLLLCLLLMMENVIVPCSECDQKFNDVTSFNKHFKRSHQSCTIYKCKLPQCSARVFNVYHAFRRHLITCHHVPVHAVQPAPVIREDSVSDEGSFISTYLDVALASPNNPVAVGTSEQSDNAVSYTDLLVKQEDRLVAKMYSNPAFPRNLVDTVVSDFSEYLTSPFFENMEQVVLSSLDPGLSPSKKQEITNMFCKLRKPFDHLQTEYKRFQYFEQCGTYIPPVSYEIDSREERCKTKDGVTLKMVEVLGQYIPLDKLLTKFLELPHVLEDTLKYMKSLETSELLCNLIQCDVWKRKVSRFKESDIVLPLNVYYDEVEPNSDLGPHCEPLGCTYAQIACLPPESISKLENIFLVLLFDANNRSLYGNKKAFRPLLQALYDLETNGITVTVPELGSVKIFIVVSLILGDNKGLNSICGLNESFSANHYCRICECSKEIARLMYVEDASLLRTPESYKEAVSRKDPEATGIKEECIFNILPSFESPTDIGVDQFHDLTEGVAHYTMVPILKHFHSLSDTFITSLNNRLYYCDLGIDSDNRPPLINLDRLLKKEKLKMTGAEMHTFVRIFGALVYDLIPDKEDPYYVLYLYLHDITSILYAKALPKVVGKILLRKVKEHHELYVLLTKENLKPKHHFLVHYIRLLLLFGPFMCIGTIRFEAKHRQVRMTANSCMSRVNLSRTVAIKQQLMFCYRCLSNSSLRQDLVHGPSHFVNLKELDTFPSFSLTLPNAILNEPMQPCVSWVTFKGTTYKPKQVLLFSVDEYGLFSFAEIELIIIHNDKPIFICSCLDTIGYFSEVRGYEVRRTSEVINWFAIDQHHLLDYNPLSIIHMSSGENVVILKHYL